MAIASAAARATVRDFGRFYREYAKTGTHAASAAILTGLGLLTTVHPGFAVVAIAAYVMPPAYLYFASRRRADPDSETTSGASQIGEQTSSSGSGTEWIEVDTPTDSSLFDVVGSSNGPYAVGAEGTVLTRRADGWEHVLEKGPTVQSNTLRGVDMTSDGRHVWFAGDSGVVARYDTEADKLTDYSAPKDNTSTWEDIAVSGQAGDEKIFLVTGSGELLRGANTGNNVRWGTTVKPGSGSSMTSVEFVDEENGYLCDTNTAVYETTDGGESYERIGIEDANCEFLDITAVESGPVMVAGDDGTVFRYDGVGNNWTKRYVDEHAITAIDSQNHNAIASGEHGTIYEYTTDGWKSVSGPIPTDATLHGIAFGNNDLDVAVGHDGTIIEQR